MELAPLRNKCLAFISIWYVETGKEWIPSLCPDVYGTLVQGQWFLCQTGLEFLQVIGVVNGLGACFVLQTYMIPAVLK